MPCPALDSTSVNWVRKYSMIWYIKYHDFDVMTWL